MSAHRQRRDPREGSDRGHRLVGLRVRKKLPPRAVERSGAAHQRRSSLARDSFSTGGERERNQRGPDAGEAPGEDGRDDALHDRTGKAQQGTGGTHPTTRNGKHHASIPRPPTVNGKPKTYLHEIGDFFYHTDTESTNQQSECSTHRAGSARLWLEPRK